ncbi:MAG: hypothetical protein KGZ39_01110 [Simkania sp.]|nr:hypothetical protein [Simkania sp.]
MTATDSADTTKFVADSANTMGLAISLMVLEGQWAGQLEQDRIQYVIDSINPDPSTALLAQSDQVTYNTDAMKKDSQCNLVQISVKTSQSNVSSDNSNRQAVFGVTQGVNGALSLANSLIKAKY